VRREQQGGNDPDDQRRSDDQLGDLHRRRQTRAAKAVVLAILVLILLLFIVWNAHKVKVSFVFFTPKIGLIWVMLACALLGGIVGFIIGRPDRAERRDD